MYSVKRDDLSKRNMLYLNIVSTCVFTRLTIKTDLVTPRLLLILDVPNGFKRFESFGTGLVRTVDRYSKYRQVKLSTVETLISTKHRWI